MAGLIFSFTWLFPLQQFYGHLNVGLLIQEASVAPTVDETVKPVLGLQSPERQCLSEMMQSRNLNTYVMQTSGRPSVLLRGKRYSR